MRAGRSRSSRRSIPSLRWLLSAGAALILGALLWSAWSVMQVLDDLRDAEEAGEAMVAAVDDGRRGEVSRQAERLAGSAARAAAGADGWWWDVMAVAPVLGDDTAALAAVTSSLDTAANDAIVPMLDRLVAVDDVTVDGRLDTDLMDDLAPSTRDVADALASASAEVADLRPSDYVGPVADAVTDWGRIVTDAARGADDAASTLSVLPEMVGSRGPRRILLVFENNAEIRATGGLPGAWTLVEADRGGLRVLRQGSGGGIDGAAPRPVPTTVEEDALFGRQLGLYFRDATMTPDYPRAAELMRDRWEAFGGEPLDGIVSVDVVSMSYLLEGLGPVQAAGVTVDADNVVRGLLNGVYENLPRNQHDAVFAQVASGIVDRLTRDQVRSSLDLLLGAGRAVAEDRMHVAWFDADVSRALKGTGLVGALVTKASANPVVDVTFNDATGAKMSYFLRYDVDVAAVDCGGGRQRLEGTMRLWQTVPPGEASRFNTYVTGGGRYGVPPGSQVVLARIYGPVAGTVRDVIVGGRAVEAAAMGPSSFRGRPVVTLALQPDDVSGTEVTWAMVTGADQTGTTRLRVTPGVEKGSQSTTAASSCPG